MPTTHQIHLPDELAQFVAQQVERGDYPSANALYQDALSLLREHSYQQYVSAKLQASQQAYKEGYFQTLQQNEIASFIDTLT